MTELIFEAKDAGDLPTKKASMEDNDIRDYSQGYSTTYFEDKSSFQDHFGFFHPSVSDTQLQQDQYNLYATFFFTPKIMKQLTRLFPNKVAIQMPQDELLLSDWKQQLDRDIETLKSQSNIVSIRAVTIDNSLF
ncbi:hypothetical protein L1887_03999 [Cichorium endivia]|nr:hypothetical protein L1887_03999 [Cichorium endivia]